MRPRVAVGIAVHAEPRRFRATLAAVRATVSPSVELLAVPGAPDAETAAALAAERGIGTLEPASTAGGAASLNRLLAASGAEVCVLLESGCLPAPRWLDHLLAGLAGHPRNGLAGPSTNRAWNEQRVAAACDGSHPAIVSVAARLEARHARAATRTLQPLYSLADFCYAVRREVWDAIGAADEGFGEGPCWEMEYNARAARAGWRGVWVPAAYVWRAPLTARRVRADAALREPNRRRYQDRLCGLRLRGVAGGYQPDCRGDACEHFAPPALVQLRIDPAPAPAGRGTDRPGDGAPRLPELPRPVSVPTLRPAPLPATLPLAGSLPVSGGVGRPPVLTTREQPPLVSCIMPTRGRPELALQAVRYFQAQDYPHRELIVLDDAGGALRERLPDDPRIRYEERPPREPIGAKRNRGVALARGELVAQWDDDDWYAPGRLSAQAAPILAGHADVTALRAEVFFELDRWRFWTCTPELHRRLFVLDVHGGTLLFRRALWAAPARYPETSLAEDAAFLRASVRAGARLQRIDQPGLFVYLRHGENAWRFQCGRYLDAGGEWRQVPEPPYLAADRAFYAARSSAPAASPAVRVAGPGDRLPAPADAGRPRSAPGDGRPLVSCLMPTADRRPFVSRAIECFLRQDYEPRELLIVDDGADPVGDLVPADTRVRYLRVPRQRSLGAKRNLACAQARGELLAHWDDDDWSAPARLSRQVAALAGSEAEACGLSVVRYFDPVACLAWEYRWPGSMRPWAGGNTLLYRRGAWERRAFEPVNEGEDTRWVWSLPAGALLTLRDPSWFAAQVHARNTSPKRTRGGNWVPIALDVVRRAMGADWACYAAMAAPARELAAV